MKNKLIAAFLLLLVGCKGGSSMVGKGHLIEAENSDNSYTVVFVNTDHASRKEAKSAALKRAAELTLEHGYRYFMVDSEESVTVSYAGDALPADNGYFPDNLDEVIIQRNYDRQSMDSKTSSQLYPGYQLTFYFSKNHSAGDTMDARELTGSDND